MCRNNENNLGYMTNINIYQKKYCVIRFSLFILLIVFTFFQVETANCHTEDDKRSPFALQEVVVSSEKIEEFIKNHPQDVQIVRRKEIEERNLSSVEEILKTISGVEVYSSAGVGTRISIRGSGKSGGVLLIQDGRPLNSNQYGGFEIGAIPVDIIESVTVFKPPVPAWLGPGGSDGVIYISTRELHRGDTKKKKTTLHLRGGSYGLFEGSLNHQLLVLGGETFLSGNVKTRDGKRLNSDRKDGSISLNWSKEGSDANKYEIAARYYESEHGAPGPIDNPTPNTRQNYRKGSIDARYKGLLSSMGTFTLNVYGDNTYLKDKSQSGRIYTTDDHKLGVKLDANWTEEKGLWDLRLNAHSEYDDYKTSAFGDHYRARFNIGSQYDRRFGALTTSIGLRVDYTNDFHFNPGVSAGLGWALIEKTLIKLKTGYTVNVPTFEQLYQTSHGSVDQIRGNPDLKEEKIWSYSIGIEYKIDNDKTIELTFFKADTRDFIATRRGADKIYQPVNVHKAERKGLELTAKYGWTKELTTELSAILQDSWMSDTRKDLLYTPKVRLKGAVFYTVPSLKSRIEASVRYESKRYAQTSDLQYLPLDKYILVDLKFIQPVKLKGLPADLYIRIDNLLNEKTFISHYGYPDDGIRLISGIQVRF